MSVIRLQDLGAVDSNIAGGKGANLGELIAAGATVPPGFVISSTTYREFLHLTGLIETLPKFIQALNTHDTQRLNFVASRIRQIIIATPWPTVLAEEITEAVDIEGEEFRYAVRSSAIGEDGVTTSFAGQHSSYLTVQPKNILKRVKQCFASLFEPRALAYRIEQGLDIADASMAVVVQRMAEVTISGVMFTADYNTGEDKVIIEAVYGLGEGLVSGNITPDHYEVLLDEEDIVQDHQRQFKYVDPVLGGWHSLSSGDGAVT